MSSGLPWLFHAVENVFRDRQLIPPARDRYSPNVWGRCHGEIAMSANVSFGSSDEAAIKAVMATYNNALNSGKTAMVLPLYTEDGVFMPPYSQSAVGNEAVQKAYEAVFAELTFDVKFNIAELVVMGPTWAYVRTNSAGTTGHHSTGKTTAEANQELFIFRKGHDGKWRIARYSFSPTNPPNA
jgi:uncharacterized protein (TIGR02246 family)